MTKRIFIVEDDPADAELLRIAFEAAADGAALTFVADGKTAVTELVNLRTLGHPPDLVLFDLHLPGDSSWSVVDLLSGEDYRSIPRAAMSSSHPSPRVQDRLARCGVRTVLVKPPSFEGFGRFIRALFDLMPVLL